jgi:hypothetical protein
MTNINDFIGQMRNFKQDLEDNFSDAMLEGATTAKSLVQHRVQEGGGNADGVPFREYAESTKKIRKSEGKQILFVDFTDTGRMWANIGVVNVKTGKNIAEIKIGGKNDATRRKLLDNTKRFGNIMDLSLAEEQDIVDVVGFGVKKIIDRNFN